MSVDFIKLLCTALENLDWNYVTLSRVQYFHEKKPPDFSSEAHWLERPFAYELYHQLRRMWDTNGFESACVIHAEVYKKYQEIKNLDKMPDFLFHLPKPDCNVAVLEIKLAANPGLQKDLDKLTLFRNILRYEHLVEIVIGTDAELRETETVLNIWAKESKQVEGASLIEILYLSLDDKSVWYRPTVYAHSTARMYRR
jgi:hypothetical protein